MTQDTLGRNKSFLVNLYCSRCGKSFEADKVQTICTSCQGTLFARYDLEKAKSIVSKEDLNRREATMWRYQELLPVIQASDIVSLGEGFTSIIPANKLTNQIGLESLLVKDDGVIPTGSFKARGQSAAISKAKELGIKSVALASAGNAGVAAAAYSARVSLECNVFMPKDAPIAAKKQCAQFGAKLHLVDGLINDCARKVVEGKDEFGWFELSTLKEPYRVEGKKTMGYEIAEQLGWDLPDVIIYPTGGGTGLVGMWKAFDELESLGWISKNERPKMISVQAAGCAPVVKAFQEQKSSIERPFEKASTIAGGLRVPFPFASDQILKVIRESDGVAISVSDEEILQAMRNFARSEGMLVCPEGAATLAALPKLLEQKNIDKKEKVLLYNTGSGLNYLELIEENVIPEAG
jgi:threonine synthase